MWHLNGHVMVLLVAAMTIGLAIGRKYQTNSLILVSVVIAVLWAIAAIVRGSCSIVDVLLLFSHLSGLQGGFLIGAYLQNKYADRRGV